MSYVTREQVMGALFTLLQTAAGFNKYTRRFTIWDQAMMPDMPLLILTEKPEKAERSNQLTPQTRTLNAEVWIYIANGLDTNTVPAIAMNNLIDAIDPASGGVLIPEPLSGRLTLGGLVWDCFVEGEITKIPGDLDGNGVAIIPLKIIIP